jgi:hypothetical protein
MAATLRKRATRGTSVHVLPLSRHQSPTNSYLRRTFDQAVRFDIQLAFWS